MMHKRSGQYVVGDALYHVVPAGEFAPSDLSLAAIDADFDLWRNITREFAEELLRLPDAQVKASSTLLRQRHALPRAQRRQGRR